MVNNKGFTSGMEISASDSVAIESIVLPKSYVRYVKYILCLNCLVSLVFYGFNATMEQYYQETLLLTPSLSGFLTNMFISLNYVFSLIGGILADEFLGRLLTLTICVWIMVVGVFICCGVSLLGVFVDSWANYLIFVGLTLFAIGNGALIPNVSAFLGDQFLPFESKLRSTYYSWYYLFTQIGSIISTFAAPILLGYSPFLLYASFVVVIIPTAMLFTIFQKNYRKLAPEKGIYWLIVQILFEGLKFWKKRSTDTHWLDKAYLRFPTSDVDDVKIMISVLVVFLPMPFFWAIYFQIFSLWIIMAENMDTTIFGFSIPAASITSLNPLMDLFLIPFFAKVIYPLFDCLGKPLTPLQKMAFGLFFTVVALVIAALVQFGLNYKPLSVFWMIPQFFFISCAEVTLSITAIEFAYTQAPARMKSFMSAVWFFTVAIGNVLVAIVALYTAVYVGLELLIFALVIFMIGGIFVGISIRYRYKSQVTAESIQGYD